MLPPRTPYVGEHTNSYSRLDARLSPDTVVGTGEGPVYRGRRIVESRNVLIDRCPQFRTIYEQCPQHDSPVKKCHASLSPVTELHVLVISKAT